MIINVLNFYKYMFIFILHKRMAVKLVRNSLEIFFNGCVIQYSAVKFLTEKKIIARDE